MSEYTKGKWKAENWLIVKDVKTPRLRYAIADTNCCDGIPDKEATANAKLIAAAPQLLEVCKKIQKYHYQCGLAKRLDLSMELDAAIAAATA